MDTPEENKQFNWIKGDPLQNVTKPVIDTLLELRKALMEQQKILMKQRIDLQKRVK